MTRPSLRSWRLRRPASRRSVFVPVELRRLVVLAGAALDLFFFGEESLQLRIGLLHERARLFGELLGFAVDLGCFRGRSATTTARTHHAARRTLTRRVADRHRGLLADLVLGGGLVGEDLALVDPDLH